jgi:hypothetical protein
VTSNSLITLGAVMLGGLMTMLGQLTLESIRSQLAVRQLRREREAAVRVIRFQFYCAQHVLKRALESCMWWGTSEELTLGEPGEDLRMLAGLLPEPEWRLYTSAWRRLRECSQLRPESTAAPGSPGEDDVTTAATITGYRSRRCSNFSARSWPWTMPDTVLSATSSTSQPEKFRCTRSVSRLLKSPLCCSITPGT